jgi:hypothetical protein
MKRLIIGITTRKAMTIRALAVGVALAAAELCGTAPAQAGSLLQAGVSTGNALVPSFINESSYHTGTTSTAASGLDVEAYAAYPGGVLTFGYHGDGRASADFLKLGAASHLILNNYDNLEYNSNSLFMSTAQSDDDLTVPGSGTGFFQLFFHLSGAGGSTNVGLIGGGVFFAATITTPEGGLGDVRRISFDVLHLPTGDLQTPLVPITFGVPFHIRDILQTSIVTTGGGEDVGPIDAGIFYGHTAAMTGVKVFDASGAELSSFTILSDSGTDYAHIGAEANVVPEPSSLVMSSIMLGLFGTGWFCRRLKQSPVAA